MIRRERYCDGRLVKETAQVNVGGTATNLTDHYVDGRHRWLFDGEEIPTTVAESVRSAWQVGQNFQAAMDELVAQAGTSPEEVQRLSEQIRKLGAGRTYPEGEPLKGAGVPGGRTPPAFRVGRANPCVREG
jgi:hypothetical protein